MGQINHSITRCKISSVKLYSESENQIKLEIRLSIGEPFDRIEDIIDPTELEAISGRYKNIARYSLESMKQ